MKQQLEHILGPETIQEQVDLFPFLSMRLHSKAQYFFEAKTKEDFIQIIQASSQLKISFIMLGGGSNLVFQSSEIKSLVVKNSYSEIKVVSENTDYVNVEVGSGTNMGVLAQFLLEKGYAGLEYHKGLPGTVGGAVYMNSKWTHPISYVGDCVLSATLINKEGVIKQVEREYFAFAYDYSNLQKTHEYIVSVVFRLKKTDVKIVKERAAETQEYRAKTQPSGKPTCGCFFQNITDTEQTAHALPTKSAGYLIDKAGMKGKSVGSFAVSDIHANFIINNGGDARPEDLITLVNAIKQQVKAKYGVELREEVEIV